MSDDRQDSLLTHTEIELMRVVRHRLTVLMKSRGISKSLLADLLGVSQNTVRKWFETSLISTRHLGMLADFFRLSSINDLVHDQVQLSEEGVKVSYARGFVDGALQHFDDPYWGATVRLGKSNLKLLEQKWIREFRPLIDNSALKGESLVKLICSLVHFFDAVRLNEEREKYVCEAINEANRLRESARRVRTIGSEDYWYKIELLLRIDGYGFNLQKLGRWDESKELLDQAIGEVLKQGDLRNTEYVSLLALAMIHLASIHINASNYQDFRLAQDLMDQVVPFEDRLNPFVRIRYLNQQAHLWVCTNEWHKALGWLNRCKLLFAAFPVIAHTEQLDHYLSRRIWVLHALGHTAETSEVKDLFSVLQQRHTEAQTVAGTWIDGYLNYARMLKECGQIDQAVRLAQETEYSLDYFRDEGRALDSDETRRRIIEQIRA